MHRFSSRLSSIMCSAVCLLALCDRATAGDRPHSSQGTAQFVSPTDYVGAGHATHLGRYTEVGSVRITPTGNPTVLRVDGTAVYTAANGDELHAVITGDLDGVTGVITATVRYVGGTGRFTTASGSARLAGQLSPSGAITASVKGTIDY